MCNPAPNQILMTEYVSLTGYSTSDNDSLFIKIPTGYRFIDMPWKDESSGVAIRSIQVYADAENYNHNLDLGNPVPYDDRWIEVLFTVTDNTDPVLQIRFLYEEGPAPTLSLTNLTTHAKP